MRKNKYNVVTVQETEQDPGTTFTIHKRVPVKDIFNALRKLEKREYEKQRTSVKK